MLTSVGSESALVLASASKYVYGAGLVGFRLGTKGSRTIEAVEERRSSSLCSMGDDGSCVGERGDRTAAAVARVTAGDIRWEPKTDAAHTPTPVPMCSCSAVEEIESK